MYHDINPVIDARFVRVLPMDWFGAIGMRMELYSCQSKLLAGLLCFTLRNDQHKTSPFNIRKTPFNLVKCEVIARVHDAFYPLTQVSRVSYNILFNCPITLSNYKHDVYTVL